MARTPQDFDDWFRKAGGDPWGYGSAFVQDRLDASLRFIGRHVNPNFSGTFIEIGAFNGEFTKRIAAKFPDALISASDISPMAVEMARTAVNGFQNVRLGCADMATFELPAGVVQPVNLLLLDCIYYLPEAERGPALEHLTRVIGPSDVFVSCPITGDPYPTERNLLRQFKKLRYRCAGAEVLNYQPSHNSLMGLRGIEWVSFELEGPTTRPIRRDFALRLELAFGIIGGCQEHRSEAGDFGIRIRSLAFDRSQQCAGFSVIRRRA
jgi:hypothetical protein